METISIILPAYNEEEGIVKTISSIPTTELQRVYNIEIMVIDNNSTDDTAYNAKRLGATVIEEKKQGYGAAYKRGFLEAKGNIIITADADGTYPLAKLPELLDIFKTEGVDFITTNRFSSNFLKLSQMPIANRVGNYMLSFVFAILFKSKVKDSQSGMWIFKRNLLETFRLRADGMGLSQEIKIEATHYNNCRWKEIDINYLDRVGTKKLRLLKDGVSNLVFLVKKKIRR